MPNPSTPNLGLTVPTPGGDLGTWGVEVNANWAVLDQLALMPFVPVNANYSAILTPFPEQVLRVTTGSSTIVVTLLPPASCPGKVWTILKIDAGSGQISIVPAAGTIGGLGSYVRTNQGGYVRVISNGVSYDVIGNN
jgi:hypothetical protein